MLGRNGRLWDDLVSGRRVLARLRACRVSARVAEMPGGHGLRSARGGRGVEEPPMEVHVLDGPPRQAELGVS